jgi:hypothetical protein
MNCFARRPAPWPVALLLAVVLAAGSYSGGVHAQATSFTFGAAGDIGGGEIATASFEVLADADTDFFLALGDMSYDQIKPESAWCRYVKQHLGDTYPFELVVGNHEAQPSGPDGFIDNFAACLPDRLGVTGLYAHQYFFDYPAGAPLARFILIDADLHRGSSEAQYCTEGDTENCDWLKARIDEAKRAGLWTIVGMHKNCLTIGIKSCEIGEPLLNLLVERKVDLVLQGHDHSYQRSKQLALGAGCRSIADDAYDADCVVDDGSDDAYLRGAGMVFIIAGVFGRDAYRVDSRDPEAGYMAAWMQPAELSNGFMQFTVTNDRIEGAFVNSIGPFRDSIAVTGAAPTPTRTASPTASPTTAPTATAAATISPTASPSATAAASPTVTATGTPAAATSPAPTITSTAVSTATPAATSTATSTAVPTAAATTTPQLPATPTPSTSPTLTPTPGVPPTAYENYTFFPFVSR